MVGGLLKAFYKMRGTLPRRNHVKKHCRRNTYVPVWITFSFLSLLYIPNPYKLHAHTGFASDWPVSIGENSSSPSQTAQYPHIK